MKNQILVLLTACWFTVFISFLVAFWLESTANNVRPYPAKNKEA